MTFIPFYDRELSNPRIALAQGAQGEESQQRGLVFTIAAFLVSVPVFFQAPLVRFWPELSLILTGGWWYGAWHLTHNLKRRLWGDLLLGFSWTWLAGSLYWGWWRQEPFLHLPIEAIALPIALRGLKKGWGKVGNSFYLGSLLGTSITDLYFYLTGLIPYWRQVMQLEPTLAAPILREAFDHLQTPWACSWAIVLILVLLAIGFSALKSRKIHAWAFAGAVLSTLLVDSLFSLAIFWV